MPVTISEVTAQYEDAIAKLRGILQDPDAQDKQRTTAQVAINDLYLQLGTNAIQRIEGRIALLTALIAELTAVIDSIKLNPVGDALDELTELIDTGRELYSKSKQDMAAGGNAGAPAVALG
jgi:uncharacterized small protein (DUF1192 family)